MAERKKPVDSGGYAFPSDTGVSVAPKGMSLRDWFAGQALSGLARDIDGDVTIQQRDSIVSSALELADAMIAERRK